MGYGRTVRDRRRNRKIFRNFSEKEQEDLGPSLNFCFLMILCGIQKNQLPLTKDEKETREVE